MSGVLHAMLGAVRDETDQHWSNVALLLRAADGIVDKGPNQLAVTHSGVTLGSQDGRPGFVFNGAQYIRFNPTSVTQLALLDFTIEAWVWVDPTQPAGDKSFLSMSAEATEFVNWTMTANAGTNRWGWYTQSTAERNIGVTVANKTGLWVHVAWVRQSQSDRMFIDGVRVTQNANVATMSSTSYNHPIVVGGFRWSAYSNYMTGKVNSVRITKGVARYWSDFTPPDELLPPIYAKTLSLLDFDGSDGSTTITDTGFSPVTWARRGTSALSTSVVKYGTASLHVPSTSSGANSSSGVVNISTYAAFTLETWFYPTSLPAGRKGIISMRIDQNYGGIAVQADGTSITWLVPSAGLSSWLSTASSAGRLTVNQWHHIALVGNGVNLACYVNGVARLTIAYPSYTTTKKNIYLGADGDGSAVGYYDNFAFSDYAKYTTNFTPGQAQ